MKVYGWNSMHPKHGQVRCILAAGSWREASRISGDSLSYMTKYGAITGNEAEITIATAKPGTVFFARWNNNNTYAYRKWK